MKKEERLRAYIKNFKKKLVASLLICGFLLSSLYLYLLFNGSNQVLNYIEKTVQQVNGRGLEFGKDDGEGFAFIRNDDDTQAVKVLQLSDIHITASAFTQGHDKKVVNAIYTIVKNNQPDLIVLTGDNIFPTIHSINSKLMIRALGSLFEKMQIPWALVFGNHERHGTFSQEKQAQYLETLEYSLFKTGEEEVSGQGNYVIKILKENGTLASALFLMDSHASVAPFVYDKLHDNQALWYEQTLQTLLDENGQIVPTHLFVHIPLYEYRVAWDLYEEQSDEVIYHYGFKTKRVAAAFESGMIFDKILEYGSTKAVFAGHDHTNTFSITYKGVILNYGMSMDYTTYPFIALQTAQRGGTLLTIDTTDGEFYLAQVPQDNGFLPFE